MRPDGKLYSPGPGQYIDLNSKHFIGNQSFSTNPSDPVSRVKSPQGSKSRHFTVKDQRFKGGFFSTKEGPGPGEYEQDVVSDSEPKGILTKAQIKNQGKGGHMFKSTTDRFLERDQKNPQVRILDKKPDYDYNDLMINNGKPQSEKGIKGMINPNKRVGFTATSPRFAHNQVFFGEKLKYTPGPGDYQRNGRPRTYSHSRGFGLRPGFGSYIQKKGTSNGVGPGSYISTECSMIKKSYNMRI